MSEKKVLIVGAGIVGLCSAYFLQKKGYDVTIMDASNGPGNCSTGNAGFLCPSHVIPLASPGIITQGLKWMFNEKSPFYIRPKLSWELLSWGLKFKKAATVSRVKRAAPLLHNLTTQSQSLAESILSEENLRVDYSKSGLLMICKSQKELDHEIHAAKIAKSFGQQVEILSRADAEKLNPGLEVNMTGAVYYPNDSMITPHQFIPGLQHLLAEKGVTFYQNTKAQRFLSDNGRIIGIETDKNEVFKADDYVIAAGSLTGSLMKPLGVNLPLQGGKGYSFVVPAPVINPQTPSILSDGKVSMSPFADGLRFSGTMEMDGNNTRINYKRIEGIIDTIVGFLPQFKREHFENIDPWVGFRPCTPDGLPYLGKTRNFKNLTIAAGHAMLGMTLGPISGHIVADLIAGENISMDLSLVDANRYL